MLKVGLAENLVHTRYGPTALARASYLTAVATGMDSFWVPDHLNSLLPRAVMTPKYVGAARLAPDTDAYLEPWSMLGNFAARDSLVSPLHNALSALPPYRGKWPEIWIAAHGPRMLRATGRYADAWFPAAT